MKRIKFWIPAAFWAGVIFWFSGLQVAPSSDFYWHDFAIKKTAHLVEYAILFLLVYRALINTTTIDKRKAALFVFLFIVLYGASDEYHQSFTPGREPRLRDVIIDGAGGGIAWLGLWKYLPKAPKKLKNLAKNLRIK